MIESPDSIEFRNHVPLRSDEEYKFEVLDSGQVIGTAYVKPKQYQQGKFWHLDDLLVQEDIRRSQGYGTKLLNHVCEYLWSLDRLRIRVHPGNAAFRQTGIKVLKTIMVTRFQGFFLLFPNNSNYSTTGIERAMSTTDYAYALLPYIVTKLIYSKTTPL